MNNRITPIVRVIVAALFVVAVAPATAHAGSVTFYNKNCSKYSGFGVVKQATVVIKGDAYGCSDIELNVQQGTFKTVRLLPTTPANNAPYDPTAGSPRECRYSWEVSPRFTVRSEMRGREDYAMTCKKDWTGVCQCSKDGVDEPDVHPPARG